MSSNAELQDRIDELVEKVNKLSVPGIRIEEVASDQEEIPLEMFQRPKATTNAKAGKNLQAPFSNL